MRKPGPRLQRMTWRACGVALSACGLAACAWIAALPDYEDRELEGGTPSDRPDGAEPPQDGDIQADGAKAPDASDASDARIAPDVAYLGCNAAAGAGLLAYWRLDEGVNGPILDCAQGAHDGTITGAVAWTPGRVGPFSLSFDGGGYVDFGTPPAFDLTGPLSITAWVKVATFMGNGRILSKGGGPGDRGWELNIENNGVAAFRVAIDAATTAVIETPIPSGQWVHLAGVYEPSVAVRLYVNGVASANTTAIPATHRNTTYGVRLGQRPGDGCCSWRGEIDDVRLFGKALGPADVAALAAQ